MAKVVSECGFRELKYLSKTNVYEIEDRHVAMWYKVVERISGEDDVVLYDSSQIITTSNGKRYLQLWDVSTLGDEDLKRLFVYQGDIRKSPPEFKLDFVLQLYDLESRFCRDIVGPKISEWSSGGFSKDYEVVFKNKSYALRWFSLDSLL